MANEQQIIIAADVTDQANDVRQTVPMTDQAIDNLDAAGVTENIGAFTADTGFFSEENMNALETHERINDVFIATGRQKHHDKVPNPPKVRLPKVRPPKVRSPKVRPLAFRPPTVLITDGPDHRRSDHRRA